MKKRKLITALIVFVLSVVFALSFVFAACGTTPNPNPSTPTTPTEPSEDPEDGDKVKSKEPESVTIGLVDGKPTYIMNGTFPNYTKSELEGLYFDFQNYPYYSGTPDKKWTTYEQKVTVIENESSYTIYVDMSSFKAGVCMIPHWGGKDEAGDIKASNGVDVDEYKSVTYYGVKYVLNSSANEYGAASVTTEVIADDIEYTASDSSSVEFNAVKLHEYFAEGLPRIDINTKNGIALDDPSLELGYNKGMSNDVMEYDYVKANVTVTDEDHPEYSLPVVEGEDFNSKVKIRGNYSSTYPKRPIRIKFNDKQKMCGIGNGKQKFKNWILLAEYKDSSLMRNSIANYLGNTILESDGYYCTDYRYVEVYLNGAYNGLYVLVEQQEVKSDRVNVTEALDPEEYPDASEAELKDPHIGYFFEFDGYYMNEAELARFAINQDWTRGYTISSDVFYVEQRDYLKTCTQSIWDIAKDAVAKSKKKSGQPFYALNVETGEKYLDPSIKSAREAIENVIDVRSLVDMFILQEICLDMDISWSSFFMSLDMSPDANHKLTFTAPWDFDSAVGNAIAEVGKFQSLNTLYRGDGGSVGANPWLALLVDQDWFWASVSNKWNMLNDAGAFDGVNQMIDDFCSSYEDAFARNQARWPSCLGMIEGQQNSAAVWHSSHVESARYVQDWVNSRISSMTNLIAQKASEYGV